MSDLKEIGENGNLLENEASERDYLKPYVHKQESRLNIIPKRYVTTNSKRPTNKLSRTKKASSKS